MATIKSQLILDTKEARNSVKTLVKTINDSGGKLDLKVDTSSINKGVTNASKTASKTLNDLGNTTSGNFKSAWSNAIDFALGSLIAKGVSTAISSIGGFVKESITASSEIQKAFTSLEVVAPNFGVDPTKAISTAKSISKELSIDYGVAAESLQNLLKSGVGLDQSVELLKRFSNEAITGKSSSLEYGTAIQNLSFAFATNNSALGNNAGISENWSDIRERGIAVLQKQGKAFKDIEKTLSAEQKASLKSIDLSDIKISKLNEEQKEILKYIGLIDLTNLTLGSAEKFQGGLVLKQIQLTQSTKDLKIAVGDLLAPAFVALVDILVPVIQKTTDFITSLDPNLVTNFVKGIIELKEEIAGTIAVISGVSLFSGFLNGGADAEKKIKSRYGRIVDASSKFVKNLAISTSSKGISVLTAGLDGIKYAYDIVSIGIGKALTTAVTTIKTKFVAMLVATQKGVLTLLIKNSTLSKLVTGSYNLLLAGSLFVGKINAIIDAKLNLIFLLMKSKILGGFAFVQGSKVALLFTNLFSGIATTGATIFSFILSPIKFIGGAIISSLTTFVITPILTLLGTIATSIGGVLVGAFSGLVTFLAPLVIALAAVAIVFGFVIAAVKRFNDPASENKSLMDQLKDAYQKFTNEVLPVLIQKFQEFLDFWNANIQPTFDKLLDIIINGLIIAFNKFKEALPGIKENFQVFIDTVQKAQPFLDGLVAAFNLLVDVFVIYLLPVLESFISGVWANLVLAFETFKPTLITLWESLQRLWDIISPVLIPVLAVLAGIVAGALYLAFVTFTVALNAIVSVIIFVINAGLNVFILAIELVGATFRVIAAVFTLVWDLIKDLFTNGGKDSGRIFNEFVDKLKKIWEDLKPKLLEIAGNMWNSLVDTVKTLATNIGNAFNDVTDAIMNTLEAIDLSQMGKDMIQGLINGVKDMAENLSGAIGGAVNGAVNSAKEALGIKSPSRVFRDQIGKQMVQGAIVGVEREQSNFDKAINNVLDVNRVSSNITNNYNQVTNNNSSNIFTLNAGSVNGVQVIPQYSL